jgi:raffinose/stachyose/melibiose transport system permease protein
MTRKRYSPYKGLEVFLIPGLIVFLILIVFPFLSNFLLSFTRWTGVRTPVWIGLANYAKALTDKIFWVSFRNNLYLILSLTTIPTLIGLLLATILYDYISKEFGKGISSIFRAGFYLPQVIPAVVSALVWRWILQPDWGVLNYILKGIHLDVLAHNWLGDPKTALLAIIVTMIWFQIGYPMVIFMAALQRIDPELYEAASIDGASWLQKFTQLTIPLIRPELFVVVLTTTIFSLKTFGQIFAMTLGGPGTATMVASYFSYKNYFQNSAVGYGATMSTVVTFIIIILTIVWVRIQTRQELREER